MSVCPWQPHGVAGDKLVGRAQQGQQGRGQLSLGLVSLRCMSLDPLTCLVASASAAQHPEQCQQLRGHQAFARSPRDREHELSIYKPRILSQTHLCHLWGQVLG